MDTPAKKNVKKKTSPKSASGSSPKQPRKRSSRQPKMVERPIPQRKFNVWIVSFGLVFLVALGSGIYWLHHSSSQAAAEDVVEPSRLNQEQIKEILKLATVDQSGSVLLNASKMNISSFRYSGSKYFVRLNGTVTGRLNADKIDITIDDEKRVINILLKKGAIYLSPPVFDENTDFEFIKIMNPGKKISKDDRRKLLYQARKELQKKAIDEGVQEKTMGGARVLLEQFVKAFGYQVTIEFEDFG